MSTAEQKAQQEIPWDKAVTDALGMDSDAVHNTRDIARAAYIKGYAAGQEDLPLAMSEEEIERIAEQVVPRESLFGNRRDAATQALRYANTRSKSLTVEKGRMFTESEVKSMLDDAEMLARIMGALVLDVDEARAMAESDISTIKVRHGISLDPA